MRRILAGLMGALAVGCGGQVALGQGTQSTVQPSVPLQQSTSPVGQPSGSAGQTGSAGPTAEACLATRIELRIGTGGDDLRGGQNNLNVEIEFSNQPTQSVPNANRSQNWPNNSVHSVVVPLGHPLPVGEIKAIRLYHIADASFNASGALASPAGPAAGIQTQDNWDMAYLKATAVGHHGNWRLGGHGAYRFTGSGPSLIIPVSAGGACGPSADSNAGGPSFNSVGSGSTGSGGGTHNSGSGSGSGSSSGGGLLSGGGGSSGRPTQASSGAGGLAAAPASSGQGSAVGSTKTVTNSDVVKMVQAGVPASAIIASIRSRPGNFDLSNKSRADLFASGGKERVCEMTEIWNAMIAKATNGRGGDGEDESCPQPNPPKGKTAAPGSAAPTRGSNTRARGGAPVATANTKIKLGTPKIGPQVKNPRAAQIDAAIIAVLQKQRQVADAEAAQMKLAIRPQGQAGLLGGQSQVKVAGGEARTSLPAVQSQSRAATGDGGGKTSLPAVQSQSRLAINNGTKSGISQGPSQTSSAPGNTSSSTARVVPNIDMTVLTCTHDPTLRILTVSGAQQAVILSADATANLYTVKGCSFGPNGANNKAWIYGRNLHVDLAIQHWDDNQIALTFDPQLRGVNDSSDVHLVLQRGDGQQLDTAGYKFYAARETLPLGGIPALTTGVFKAATGGHFDDGDTGNQESVGFSTPASDYPSAFAEVSRWMRATKDRPSGNVFIADNLVGKETNGEDFVFVDPSRDKLHGSDFFDFSKLAPGFATYAFALMGWQPSGDLCPSEADSLQNTSPTTDGSWNADWDGNNIRVSNWVMASCRDLEVFAETFVKQSQYALQVWVVGPRGIDPWTGQPTKQ
jgi:hypothetical protein